jgi:hypothetical protein
MLLLLLLLLVLPTAPGDAGACVGAAQQLASIPVQAICSSRLMLLSSKHAALLRVLPAGA